MAWNARTWWLVGTGGASALAVGALVFAWSWGQDTWWHVASAWPLDESEQAAVDACEDPEWTGLLKVLEQDLDVACPADWFAGAARDHLKARHVRRVRWLRDAARDEARSSRTRFRAATALLVGGHETLPGLAVLTRGADLAPTRPRLAQVVAEGSWPVEWADPELRGDAAVEGLTDDESDTRVQVIARMRHEALFEDGDRGARAHMVERGLDVLGLGDGVLEDALDRRDRGLGQYTLPAELNLAVVNRGHVCRERSTSACLRFVADLLEMGSDDGGGSEPARAVLPVPLWEVLYDDQPGTVDTRAEVVGGIGAWIASAPARDRAERLLAVLADGDPDRGGRAGDPADVVRRHAGPPWTTALTALSLAEVAGVDVSVAADSAGVWLRADALDLRLQPCGVRLPVDEAAVRGEAWPPEAVLAQAVLEAATEAHRDERVDLAQRLAGLAARIDSVGAGPAAQAYTLDELASPGRAAAALLTTPTPAAPAGAEDPREELAKWALERSFSRLDCSGEPR